MNRVLTCVFAGAMALSLQSTAALAQEEEAPPPESKPVPLTEAKAGDLIDLLAEDKDGNVLGIVFDVALDDSGKAKTLILELFQEEEGMGEEPPANGEEEAAAEEEPAEAEGEEPEEPVFIGRLIAVSPKGAQLDNARGVVMLPSLTAAKAEEMDAFAYEKGMKTVVHPDGYTEAPPAEEESEEGEE